MNDFSDWLAANDRYLAAALGWLRARLERLAAQAKPLEVATAEIPQVVESPEQTHWLHPKQAATTQEMGPEDQKLESEAHLPSSDVAIPPPAIIDAEAAEHPPALVLLSHRLGLSAFERNILLLCAAMELETRIAELCAGAQANSARPYPTFALALALFDEPSWDAFSAERPLRYWQLIQLNQPGATPLTTSALRADERIVHFIKGLNTLDDRVAGLLKPVAAIGPQLPPSQQDVTEAILHHVRESAAQRAPVVQLVGPDSHSKQLMASQAAAALGLNLYSLPAETLPTHPAELETLARLWQRETLLLPVALYLDAHEADHMTAPETGLTFTLALRRFLARNRGLCFLGTREAWPGLGETIVAFDVSNPTPAEQQALWAAALGPVAGQNPVLLAGQFNLDQMTIGRIAQMALAEHRANETALQERLWSSCLASTRPQLDALAQRLDPKATWKDIVLPAEATTLLHQIVDQVRHRLKVYDEWGFREKMNRGLGISALFTGESGTGKTMAAEVIANELRLDLYRIDLSAVVSKYIGETEKNLRRLFDAAEDRGAILFFDEADALFGKRSEVKDSHDRYANIETNYLLQRMEAFRGLAILATNMKSALDTAFTRRLRFMVPFPFPSVSERKLMWEKALPPQMPKLELDYDRLARINLTGGSIHNIALNAAFLAATRDPLQVTMPLILEAARTEFLKMEKPLNVAEFRMMEPVGGAG